MNTAKLPGKLVELARAEVGVEEMPPGSNCGPMVNLYKSATNLPPAETWPWCAAFVCWIVREAMKATGTPETATFKRPRTAGAWDFIRWSREQDNSTKTRSDPNDDIQPGDIVVFRFSHIGIAVSGPQGSYFETVEGNTDSEGSREGGGVFHKRRKLAQVRARIRFTV